MTTRTTCVLCGLLLFPVSLVIVLEVKLSKLSTDVDAMVVRHRRQVSELSAMEAELMRLDEELDRLALLDGGAP
jgi:hypothetical protein